ncbi:hypothetical protein KCQ_21250 [Pectobacterium atrosepticum ICMP 1526]|nr:hypothetical protein KCQ_21250 [Pectobacterium atrosepticum ICMP 1526]
MNSAIDMMKSRATFIRDQRVDTAGIRLGTFATVQAFIRGEQDLVSATYSLWIGAPRAANIAALHKDQRTNAIPVVDRILLNIEYSACDVFCWLHLSLHMSPAHGKINVLVQGVRLIHVRC